jgi:hypothetical protein
MIPANGTTLSINAVAPISARLNAAIVMICSISPYCAKKSGGIDQNRPRIVQLATARIVADRLAPPDRLRFALRADAIESMAMKRMISQTAIIVPLIKG